MGMFDDLLPQDKQKAPVGLFDDLVPAAPVWSGTILPASTDAQGKMSFDSNAGILGVAKRAFMAPGDVLLGKIPTYLPNGQPNPELLRRAFDAAALASPISAASRAGVGWAGAPLANLGRETIAPPTAQALKDAGSEGYIAARASGIDINSDAVANMARGLQTKLEDDGIIAELAPKTFSVLGKITNPPDGSIATIANLQAIKRSFGEALRSSTGPDHATDRKAAGDAIRAIGQFLDTLDPAAAVAGTATPEAIAAVSSTLRNADKNYGAAQRSNDLTGELDRAVTGITERAANRAQATNSGRNFDNALRQRVASMMEKPRDVMGYSDEEIAALNKVLQGGWVRNRARDVGNVLGAGGGLGQAVASMGLAGGGYAGLGPLGVALGLVPPVLGGAAKALENALARRSMRQADDVVRHNSPLYREMQTQAPVLPAMSARDMAVLRALLPGLLSPQPASPQVVSPFGGFI